MANNDQEDHYDVPCPVCKRNAQWKHKIQRVLLKLASLALFITTSAALLCLVTNKNQYPLPPKTTEALIGNWTPEKYQHDYNTTTQKNWKLYWKDTLCFVSGNEMLHKIHVMVDTNIVNSNKLLNDEKLQNIRIKTRYHFDTHYFNATDKNISAFLRLFVEEQIIECDSTQLKDAFILEQIDFPKLKENLSIEIEVHQRGKHKMNIYDKRGATTYYNGYHH
jgi:hypothetical protein